ncbi:uncharacterized protein LOC134437500 [Engraulis encrasicolus]|uniref:uncharacterized protein LOC134437500 n=1 Tax=Engraulis encrasicolus TaxID=184585 RepID=UPI002FD0E3FD
MSRLCVAIIGAGGAGLCAARHLLSKPGTFAPPVVYEQTNFVGGTWVYEDKESRYDDGKPIHSSMYRDLRTNIPKEVMAFPDFPFDDHLPSFLHHTEVRKYLERYCDHFKMKNHIKFNTTVDAVKPVKVESGWRGLAWDVTSSDGRDPNTSVQRRFDAVLVCNGHFFNPYIPAIPGLEKFSGALIHSHDYCSAVAFAGKSVVMLGAGPSGTDIAMELSKVNAKVVLSHGQKRLKGPLPPGVRQAPPVSKVLEDGTLEFHDGQLARPDVFMFCTGYNYKFPFLDERVGVEVKEHMVYPLYKFLIPPAFPSLFIVGLCRAICPFPHFHMQSQFIVSVLDGSFPLPSPEEMEKDIELAEAARRAKGIATRHILKLDSDQWTYNQDLARIGGFKPLPPYWRSLYESNKVFRSQDMQNYKSFNYRVLGDDEWMVLGPQGQPLPKPVP